MPINIKLSLPSCFEQAGMDRVAEWAGGVSTCVWWVMGIAVVADPPVSVHLIPGLLCSRHCLCNASLPKIMLSYVVLTEVCVSPCHVFLPERAALSQVSTLKGTSLTLYSTLGYSNKLFTKAATPPVLWHWFRFVFYFSLFHCFLEAICPTNPRVSHGLQLIAVPQLNVCQGPQWSFRPLKHTLMLTAELMNKTPETVKHF